MDTQMFKDKLLARRDELTQNMGRIERELDRTPTKDLEDFSTERQGDEVLEALGQAELDEVRRIDLALARIAQGTYGLCAACGEPIAQARLALVPETPLCKSCAH